MNSTQPLLSGLLKTDEIYILFGGPSLRGFDFSKLNGRAVLACNKCAEEYPADCVISIDPTYINTKRDFLRDYPGQVALSWRGTKTGDGKKPNDGVMEKIKPDYLYFLDRSHPDKMSEDTEILYGTNTGHAAVNFAILQGFKTIHALGLDMKPNGHWHDGYHSRQHAGMMEYWAMHLDVCKKHLEKKGVKMINYNLNSACRAYDFRELHEI